MMARGEVMALGLLSGGSSTVSRASARSTSSARSTRWVCLSRPLDPSRKVLDLVGRGGLFGFGPAIARSRP